MNPVALRDVIESDLPVFYLQQLDKDANYMAAFTAEDPADEEHFRAFWARILSNPAVLKQTIVYGDRVAGNISFFEMFGQPSIGYWIGKEYWGNGIATAALRLFLDQIAQRPVYARVAHDNHASLRVLQKCGFVIEGEDRGFAHARGEEIREYILRLDDLSEQR